LSRFRVIFAYLLDGVLLLTGIANAGGPVYYFAYASNLNKKQMKERCPAARPVSIVTLHHYKLVFKGWSRKWRGGVATIQPFRGERVLGAIYELSEDDMRRLDKYEDCPATYSRFKVGVNKDFGELIEAETYIRSGRADEAPPSREYLAVIQQGYRDWGII
jgi:gamma-glutamylcyclotransferase